MKYDWSSKVLEEHRQEIKKLLKNKQDYSKQELKEMHENLKQLKMMLNYHQNKRSIFECPKLKLYLDKNCFIPSSFLKDFEQIPISVKKTITKNFSNLNFYPRDYKDLDLPKLSLTHQELIDMSLDFYATLPTKEYKSLLKKFTDPHEHLIKFTNNEYTDYSGITKPFFFPRYISYFEIALENNILDFVTLNHELAHGIYFTYEKSSSLNDIFYLTEIEGYFFDYLSVKYLENKLSPELITILNKKQLLTFYEDFYLYYLINISLFLYNRTGLLEIEDINQLMLEQGIDFLVDESNLLEIGKESPIIKAKYIYSYLINLSLQKIYEDDPEFAFNLLKRIRSSRSLSIIEELHMFENINLLDSKSLKKEFAKNSIFN